MIRESNSTEQNQTCVCVCDRFWWNSKGSRVDLNSVLRKTDNLGMEIKTSRKLNLLNGNV